MTKKFVSFSDFVSPIVEARANRIASLADRFGKNHSSPNKDNILNHYLSSVGFEEFLSANKGVTLTLENVHSLVKTYMVFGDREIQDIPALLGLFSRQYRMRLPAVEGLFTVQYWYEHTSSEAVA